MIRMNIANEETGITISLKSTDALTAEELQAIYNLVNKVQPKASQVRVTMPSQGLERYFDKFPQAVPLKDEVKPRPRAIELLNTERSLFNPIGDLLKEPDDRKHVKVYINCPACGHECDHFNLERSSWTKCPSCKMMLFNAYATDASLEPDEDGYVYMATSEFKPKRRYDEGEEAE
jgi:hypothetical protein